MSVHTRHPFMPFADFQARRRNTSSSDSRQLIAAYAEIASLTALECGVGCGTCDTSRALEVLGPDRCCDRLFCEMARLWAKDVWGVRLRDTGHPRVPFMGPLGCTVSPHLRPLCSIYSCHIERGRTHLATPDRAAKFENLLELICRLEGVGP